MQVTTRVFTSGNSQAVRIPKHFRLDTTDVLIHKESNGALVLTPRPEVKVVDWDAYLQRLDATPMEVRQSFPLKNERVQPPKRANPFDDWREEEHRAAA